MKRRQNIPGGLGLYLNYSGSSCRLCFNVREICQRGCGLPNRVSLRRDPRSTEPPIHPPHSAAQCGSTASSQNTGGKATPAFFPGFRLHVLVDFEVEALEKLEATWGLSPTWSPHCYGNKPEIHSIILLKKQPEIALYIRSNMSRSSCLASASHSLLLLNGSFNAIFVLPCSDQTHLFLMCISFGAFMFQCLPKYLMGFIVCPGIRKPQMLSFLLLR